MFFYLHYTRSVVFQVTEAMYHCLHQLQWIVSSWLVVLIRASLNCREKNLLFHM